MGETLQQIVAIHPDARVSRKDLAALRAVGLVVVRADPAHVSVIVPTYAASSDLVAQAAFRAIAAEQYGDSKTRFAKELLAALTRKSPSPTVPGGATDGK